MPPRLTAAQVGHAHPQREPQRPGIAGHSVKNRHQHGCEHGDTTPASGMNRAIPAFRAIPAAANQAGIRALACITDSSRQPDKPTEETEELLRDNTLDLRQSLQIDLADAGASEQPDDGIRNVAERFQQSEIGHAQQENSRKDG